MVSKIVVFGSFITDLTSRAEGLPGPGQTILGSKFQMGPGGKGSNQAVAAHRAGADITIVTKVGRDAFGQMALDFYKSEGMNTEYVFQDGDNETGTALIMVDSKSCENQILVVSGACGHVNAQDIAQAEDAIRDASIILLQMEVNFDAVFDVIKIAKKHGVKVVLNPAPALPLPYGVFPKIDIFTPNEHEAYEYTGVKVTDEASAAKAAAILMDKGIGNVAITMGKSGVYVTDGKKGRMIESFTVDAVDTTGAGDAFNGAFVTALSEGADIFEAALFGNAAAALSVTREGTAPAMPGRQEIDRLISRIR